MILRDLMRILGSSARRDGRNLTSDEAYGAFRAILSGEATEIQAGAFLIALRWKGVTVEEVTGFARAARDNARIPCAKTQDLVCVCPSQEGVEHVPPLELAASLIAASAGVKVLVISDRCVPPKRGLTAASALEGMGMQMTFDPSEAEAWVDELGFAVVAASGMLPALLSLRKVRTEIGVRTPLSTVEKLLAPRNASIVVGAQGGPVLGLAVGVVQSLGHPRGIVVQGLEAGVIPSVRRRTRGIEFSTTQQVTLSIEPGDFGIHHAEEPDLPMFGPPEDGLGCGDNPLLVQASGRVTAGVLSGEMGAARDAALLGAAVILRAAGGSLTIADGVGRANEALDSGATRRLLERLRAKS